MKTWNRKILKHLNIGEGKTASKPSLYFMKTGKKRQVSEYSMMNSGKGFILLPPTWQKYSLVVKTLHLVFWMSLSKPWHMQFSALSWSSYNKKRQCLSIASKRHIAICQRHILKNSSIHQEQKLKKNYEKTEICKPLL